MSKMLASSAIPSEPAIAKPSPCTAKLVAALRLFLVALLIGIAVLSPASLRAQSDNSSIAGVITDPSGATVGAAAVTVISEQTGAEHKTVSNKSGFYTIAGLAPGKYTVKVVAPGFDAITQHQQQPRPRDPSDSQHRARRRQR